MLAPGPNQRVPVRTRVWIFAITERYPGHHFPGGQSIRLAAKHSGLPCLGLEDRGVPACAQAPYALVSTFTRVCATSRLRCPRSSRSPVGVSPKPMSGLLPGCAVPRHGKVSCAANCGPVTSRLRNRKSRCPTSSVCSLQVWAVRRFRNCATSRLRNPTSSGLSRWCCAISGRENRVTSRLRCPTSSCVSSRLGHRSSGRGNGLLPGCAVPGHGWCLP